MKQKQKSKTVVVNFRMNTSEFKSAKASANDCGIDVAEYLRLKMAELALIKVCPLCKSELQKTN